MIPTLFLLWRPRMQPVDLPNPSAGVVMPQLIPMLPVRLVHPPEILLLRTPVLENMLRSRFLTAPMKKPHVLHKAAPLPIPWLPIPPVLLMLPQCKVLRAVLASLTTSTIFSGRGRKARQEAIQYVPYASESELMKLFSLTNYIPGRNTGLKPPLALISHFP
jgi:hypothetical protein